MVKDFIILLISWCSSIIMSVDPDLGKEISYTTLMPSAAHGAPARPIEAGDTTKRRRHVIKAKNIKFIAVDHNARSSPFAKGIEKRLSKVKRKKELVLSDKPTKESDVSAKTEDQTIRNNITTLSVKQLNNEVDGVILLEKDQPDSNSVDFITPNAQQLSKGGNEKESKLKKSKAPSKKIAKVSARSHVLTDYYTVRRSSRKTKSLLQKEQNDFILKAIESKSENGLSVVEFEGKGRGVIAERSFKKGSFVVEYAGDLINWTEAKKREQEYSNDPSVGCYMYYFVYDNTNYCVDATAESGCLGRLLNHSRKNPNCKTMLVPVPNPKEDGTLPRLVIIAKRDISAGEELTYDYGDRDKETLRLHQWLKTT